MSLFVLAQAPQAINYKCVARDAAGAVLSNQSIALQLSIRSGSARFTDGEIVNLPVQKHQDFAQANAAALR